jgi:hypothetical protein
MAWFAGPKSTIYALATHIARKAEFESRPVKWRAGQDKDANTYVIEISL